jgi:DNA processing protein
MEEKEAAVIVFQLDVPPSLVETILESFISFCHFLELSPSAAPSGLASVLKSYQDKSSELLRAAQDYIQVQSENDVTLIAVTESRYPELLRQTHRPPLLLHIRGDPEILSLPQVAIVGSRKSSRGGLQQAESFASALAASGFVITSGLALGIDGAAHKGALATGKTIAVVGAGVDVVYPRQHQYLYDSILDKGGAIISELKPGSPPLRQHFPRRNRIISGLACGVLVVEAALKSGSLITARFALEQGREVFAVPGSIHNPMAKGCHQLIREGAVLTETLDDIVSQLDGMLALSAESLPVQSAPVLEPGEKAVLEALGFDPRDFDSLLSSLSLSVPELTQALISLEMHSMVETVAGKYQRIR